MSEVTREQQVVCARVGARPYPTPPDSKVGAARNIRNGLQPLNGLRHLPEADTSGWYLWAGTELSDEPDFFVPIHASHLAEWNPTAISFLALPPGWRFLKAPDAEDIWEDPTLLD
jgi:hypothetical protein